MPHEWTDDIIRTAAPGVWLLSSNRAYPRLLHVIDGRIVSTASPPATHNHSTYLHRLAGSADSPMVFAVGQATWTGFPAALTARYHP